VTTIRHYVVGTGSCWYDSTAALRRLSLIGRRATAAGLTPLGADRSSSAPRLGRVADVDKRNGHSPFRRTSSRGPLSGLRGRHRRGGRRQVHGEMPDGRGQCRRTRSWRRWVGGWSRCPELPVGFRQGLRHRTGRPHHVPWIGSRSMRVRPPVGVACLSGPTSRSQVSSSSFRRVGRSHDMKRSKRSAGGDP
jgi:hypothetical protein